MIIFFILLLPGCFGFEDVKSIKARLDINKDGSYSIVEIQDKIEGSNSLATAEYKNAINQTGWAFLDISTSQKFTDKKQAFGAGFLEGALTSELLYMYYQNTIVGRCDGKEQLCASIDKWLDESLKWIESKIKQSSHRKGYWHHVSLFMTQLTGIAEGYHHVMKDKNKTITLKDIIVMNVFGDLEDLESALNPTQLPNKVLGKGHCSALLRLLPGNADLLVSHDTWNSYQSMLRIIKKYNMPFKRSSRSSEIIPGHTLSFSGYPGVIYSGDDFSILSSGLTVLETTIGNSNPDLWTQLTPHSVLEGIRSTVANRLATDGRSWTNIFSIHNSGTYNNQWMVVDYNQFTPGDKELKPNLLWVLEQIPGYIQTKDLTQIIESQGFWPSYNSPYFKDVYNMSGNQRLVEQYGDWFSYEKTPRAQIFHRDAVKVTDIPSMIKLMRYNNYTQDPLSVCDCSPPYSAENSISARNDLNPLWSEQDFKDTPHVGQPDLWQFDPVEVTWN
ncbi:putative phospholipase B-like 2 isoform X2 [Eurytemora carolleeae]|uniref:putative phospholipase B-like 2 isoform X2 n=1 Tax=Eurytemora carolleeae TaxID=1294199 RepID=UPI000C78BAC3|nr:putative phospholipase B-like 2 isoform X2 [Eurytemora carolleeae]|eukprot:XP_023326751.1 putative phospholipase B-like 2 isoform X2 [Eurytemora affinis]